jgi:hypothetical protein
VSDGSFALPILSAHSDLPDFCEGIHSWCWVRKAAPHRRVLGDALVEAGRRVFYTRTTDVVQRLQAARRDLALEAVLAKLHKYDLNILDDID